MEDAFLMSKMIFQNQKDTKSFYITLLNMCTPNNTEYKIGDNIGGKKN